VPAGPQRDSGLLGAQASGGARLPRHQECPGLPREPHGRALRVRGPRCGRRLVPLPWKWTLGVRCPGPHGAPCRQHQRHAGPRGRAPVRLATGAPARRTSGSERPGPL
ncbi:MAG: COGs COG3558, partial [uncultured Craurococcus sp.]